MTDYTKLVAALRILQDKNSLSYYKRQVCKDAADAIEALIADVEKKESRITGLGNRIFALEQQLPKRGEWVRVEDELPNDGDWAIFTNGKVVSVERFKEDAYNHFFPASQWFDFEDAIAWMPLPEPPKEDADADK